MLLRSPFGNGVINSMGFSADHPNKFPETRENNRNQNKKETCARSQSPRCTYSCLTLTLCRSQFLSSVLPSHYMRTSLLLLNPKPRPWSIPKPYHRRGSAPPPPAGFVFVGRNSLCRVHVMCDGSMRAYGNMSRFRDFEKLSRLLRETKEHKNCTRYATNMNGILCLT